MAFKADEICVLSVGGQNFQFWKTVLVQLTTWAPNNYARFTTSEDITLANLPINASVSTWRLRPGLRCTITLGGQHAISGIIVTRQVAYSATSHVVELIVKTLSYTIVKGAAVVPGMEFPPKVKFPEIATKLLANHGVGYTHMGGDNDQHEFERVNVQGKTTWQAIEEHARVAGVVVSPDPQGTISMIGTAPSQSLGGMDAVIEGKNILEGREIISIETGMGPATGTSQGEPNHEKHGAEMAYPKMGKAASGIAGALDVGSVFGPISNMVEVPGGMNPAKAGQARAAQEAAIKSLEEVQVEALVHGWLRPSGGLWRPLQMVFVKSPMLLMNEALVLKTATFTQDDRTGSRTLLEMHRRIPEKR